MLFLHKSALKFGSWRFTDSAFWLKTFAFGFGIPVSAFVHICTRFRRRGCFLTCVQVSYNFSDWKFVHSSAGMFWLFRSIQASVCLTELVASGSELSQLADIAFYRRYTDCMQANILSTPCCRRLQCASLRQFCSASRCACRCWRARSATPAAFTAP